jgi:predicted transcriptional regulator
VPVVDADDTLVGIISYIDVLRNLPLYQEEVDSDQPKVTNGAAWATR